MRWASADVYGFFYHAIPPEGTLSLEGLHSIISNVWLTRHDDELEQERAARRKGRPKSTKELKLEEIKLRESEQYRTGMGKIEYHTTCHC
jgi:translation machinery-associated protein 16